MIQQQTQKNIHGGFASSPPNRQISQQHQNYITNFENTNPGYSVEIPPSSATSVCDSHVIYIHFLNLNNLFFQFRIFLHLHIFNEIMKVEFLWSLRLQVVLVIRQKINILMVIFLI